MENQRNNSTHALDILEPGQIENITCGPSSSASLHLDKQSQSKNEQPTSIVSVRSKRTFELKNQGSSHSNVKYDKMCVIGLGLMGASLALAVKEAEVVGKLSGYDIKPAHCDAAVKLDVVKTVSSDIKKSINGADIIILATPVSTFSKIIEVISANIKPGATIIDLGSTKKTAVDTITPHIPKGVHYVPCHPITGSDKSGPVAGTASLFSGKKCVITPTSSTNKAAMNKVIALWESVGSIIEMRTSEEHDRIYAGISHLPQILASVLSFITCAETASNCAGQGYRDMTRLANSSPEMWEDILVENSQEINGAIMGFIHQLITVSEDIENLDRDRISSFLKQAKKNRAFLDQ